MPLMRGLKGSSQFEFPRSDLWCLRGKADVSGNPQDPQRGHLELAALPRPAPLQGTQAETAGVTEARVADEVCTEAFDCSEK